MDSVKYTISSILVISLFSTNTIDLKATEKEVFKISREEAGKNWWKERISLSKYINLSKKWKKIDYKFVKKAQLSVPKQWQTVWRSWSCGPNSVLRSYYLLDNKCGQKYTQSKFINECPKSLGEPVTREGISLNLKAVITATLLSPLIPGLVFDLQEINQLEKENRAFTFLKHSFALLLGVVSISPYILETLDYYQGFGKAGPLPYWLANYAKGKYLKPERFSLAVDKIKENIDNKKPVIILLVLDSFAWHYVNVIGYNNDDKQFIILDTDSDILKIKHDTLQALMNARWYNEHDNPYYNIKTQIATSLLLNYYNLITFDHCPL